MLDSNVISDLVRNPESRVTERIRQVGESNLCTSIIVAAELRFGAAKRGSSRLRSRVDGVLARIGVLPLQPPADESYALLRTQLERIGRVIGSNDLLIAAHAMTADCILVTDNEREFAGVRRLRCENWLREK